MTREEFDALLDEYSIYGFDWNGYDALPPDRKSLELARKLGNMRYNAEKDVYHAVISTSGKIILICYDGEKEVRILCRERNSQ